MTVSWKTSINPKPVEVVILRHEIMEKLNIKKKKGRKKGRRKQKMKIERTDSTKLSIVVEH